MADAKASAANRKTTLHVIEEHPIAVSGLRRILGAFRQVTFHQETSVSPEPQGSVVLIVDAGTLKAPLGRVLRYFRTKNPDAPVVVPNVTHSSEYIGELLFLGIAGFVAYNRVQDELCDAIRSVASGRPWIDAADLSKFSRRRLLLANGQRAKSLTSCEKTILGLLERGYCKKEIAFARHISVSTVKFHLKNIFVKIDIHDRLRAAQWAKRYGLAEPNA